VRVEEDSDSADLAGNQVVIFASERVRRGCSAARRRYRPNNTKDALSRDAAGATEAAMLRVAQSFNPADGEL
jgi:hypothetical protein